MPETGECLGAENSIKMLRCCKKANSIKKTTDDNVEPKFWQPQKFIYNTRHQFTISRKKMKKGGSGTEFRWLLADMRPPERHPHQAPVRHRCRLNFTKGSGKPEPCATPLKTGCLSLLPNMIFWVNDCWWCFWATIFLSNSCQKQNPPVSAPLFPPNFRVRIWKSTNNKTYIYIIPQETKAPLARITDAKKIWGKTSSWNFFSPQAPQYFWSPIASRSVEGGVIAKDVAKHTPKEPKVEHT